MTDFAPVLLVIIGYTSIRPWAIASMVICGLAGGYLSAYKGRQPVLGIMLGILLGPCGLIILIILPMTESGRAQQEMARKIANEDVYSTKTCPTCGRENSISTPVCPRCETRLAD